MAHILTLQSHVVYGHAGNAAAVFPMQRLGHEVSALNLLQFSNHTGYGTWGGSVISAAELRDVLQGLRNIGVWGTLDAIISGYIGNVEQAEVMADMICTMKKQRPQLLYCCDPVMGDVGRGLYIKPELAHFIRTKLLPLADWITPNIFELSQLAQTRVTNIREAMSASQVLVDHYGFGLLATSIADSPTQTGLSLATTREAYYVTTPRYDLRHTVHGTGDVTAASFMSHVLHGDIPRIALEKTASTIHAITRFTFEQGLPELAIIPAQAALLTPQPMFKARPV